MSEYTPTTEDVKEGYSFRDWADDDPDAHVIVQRRLAAEFDRWLAEHDRQTAERAWTEGAKWGALQVAGLPDTSLDYVQIKDGANPYRKEQADE